MKKYLLLISVLFIAQIGFSQVCVNCGGINSKSTTQAKVELAIYPNPAVDYIVLSNDDNVNLIYVYNLVGKLIETFEAESGAKYDVRDLPNGLYLVQVVGRNNKILTTQRLHKRA